MGWSPVTGDGSAEAIVLRLVPYRDADVIATLFCLRLGKIAGLARAARKSRRRFGGALGMLTVIRADLAEKRSGQLWTMRSAEPIETFSHLASDMATFAHANYATELVRELTADEQPDDFLFELLLSLYRELGAGASVGVLRAFELALLGAIGVSPILTRCVACGTTEPARLDELAVLDPTKGGVLCGQCSGRHRGPGARSLGGAARRFLVAAQTVDGLAAARELGADPVVASSARDALLAVVLSHVGKPLRSLEFIKKLSRS